MVSRVCPAGTAYVKKDGKCVQGATCRVNRVKGNVNKVNKVKGDVNRAKVNIDRVKDNVNKFIGVKVNVNRVKCNVNKVNRVKVTMNKVKGIFIYPVVCHRQNLDNPYMCYVFRTPLLPPPPWPIHS